MRGTQLRPCHPAPTHSRVPGMKTNSAKMGPPRPGELVNHEKLRWLGDWNGANYAFVLPSAACDKRLTIAHLRLLILIGRVNRGWCAASQKSMAELLGLKSRTVNDAIQDLVKWQYLQIKRQSETHTAICHYRVNGGDADVPVIAGTSRSNVPAITGTGSGNDRNVFRPLPEPPIIVNARASDQSDQEINNNRLRKNIQLGTDECNAYHLPFSETVIAEISALAVDVERLIDRYARRTKGKRIGDPSNYLLGMAHDEVAKRNGVTAEQVKKSTARNRDHRIEAAESVVAAFSAPSPEAIALARRRGRLYVDEVLALIARREFKTQQDCDRAFDNELANARFRPPTRTVVEVGRA